MKKICTMGLWHLGSVTAGYLAKLGFQVTGFDADPKIIRKLQQGKAPLHEPGLDALIQSGLASGHLNFTHSLAKAVKGCQAVWITIDTPVQWDDHADLDYLRKQARSLIAIVDPGTSILISSQVPVGFCREFDRLVQLNRHGDDIALCYSPENLRLGKALELMENPDRIVVGLSRPEDQKRFEPFFSALSQNILWMGLESAEMTKHAINAFLATSVVFANELASLCESVGADAQEVADGLLSESRIGPRAYLRPGSAFAGGTLARDVQFLIRQEKHYKIPSLFMEAVLKSNQRHQEWIRRKMNERFKKMKGRTVSVFGLTYKANTDTLRRSWVIELCRWLNDQGARIQAFDPLVKQLPKSLSSIIQLKDKTLEAFRNSNCAVVATDHQEIRAISLTEIESMSSPFVLDPNGVLRALMRGSPHRIDYRCVGYESRKHSKNYSNE